MSFESQGGEWWVSPAVLPMRWQDDECINRFSKKTTGGQIPCSCFLANGGSGLGGLFVFFIWVVKGETSFTQLSTECNYILFFCWIVVFSELNSIAMMRMSFGVSDECTHTGYIVDIVIVLLLSLWPAKRAIRGGKTTPISPNLS